METRLQCTDIKLDYNAQISMDPKTQTNTDFCKFSSCEGLAEMHTSPLIHIDMYSATWFRNWTSARKLRCTWCCMRVLIRLQILILMVRERSVVSILWTYLHKWRKLDIHLLPCRPHLPHNYGGVWCTRY